MSKVAISGNASGTGTFTIQAPNSNTDRVLSLPDEAGTVLTSGTPLSSFPSGFANGITMIQEWRLTTDLSSNGTVTPLEVVDEATSGSIGTGMSESSGIFTFPETGIYWIIATMKCNATADDNISVNISVSTDSGSNYDIAAESFESGNGGAAVAGQGTCSYIMDVQNASTARVKFEIVSLTSGVVQGVTSNTRTGFTFIRLGDT